MRQAGVDEPGQKLDRDDVGMGECGGRVRDHLQHTGRTAVVRQRRHHDRSGTRLERGGDIDARVGVGVVATQRVARACAQAGEARRGEPAAPDAGQAGAGRGQHEVVALDLLDSRPVGAGDRQRPLDHHRECRRPAQPGRAELGVGPGDRRQPVDSTLVGVEPTERCRLAGGQMLVIHGPRGYRRRGDRG